MNLIPDLTLDQLCHPAIMVETLNAAYQHMLDQGDHMCGGTPTRLSPETERELGRRLAAYWLMEHPVAVKPKVKKPTKMDRLVADLRAGVKGKARS